MQIEIPGYRIIRTLGKGGMASVYLAIQESFEREVALKVMTPDLSKDESFGERFLHEARIVSRLVHPNIVTVYDVGIHDGYYFLSMEYIPGDDLTHKRYELSLTDNLLVVKDIARALDFAGKKGCVHRDVKPDNIMLHEESGRAVLMDFGIARISDTASGMTQTGMAIGTPHYMSPEQARGQTVDERADLYSLGVVLFLLLTGRVPFHADSAVVVGIMHVSEDIPRLPPALKVFQPIIDRALAKNPLERYQTGTDLIADLDAITMQDIAEAEKGYAQELAALVATDRDINRSNAHLSHAENAQLDAAVTSPFAHTVLTPRATSLASTAVLPQVDAEEPVGFRSEPLAATADDRVARHNPVAKEKTTVRGYLLLLVILILAAGGFYLLTEFQQDQRDNNAVAAPLVVDSATRVNPELAAEILPEQAIEPSPPAWIDQAKNLRAQLDQDASQLGELAPQLVSIYRSALQGVNPQEQKIARTELEAFQDFYAAQITLAIETRDMTRAWQLAEASLDFFAETERTVALQEVLSLKDHDDNIAKQLQQAEGYLTQDALTAPVAANALELYQAVLLADPENALARAGIEKISRRYGELAVAQQNEGNIAQALHFVAQGLALTIDSPELLEQRQSLLQLQEVQRQRQAAQQKSLETALAQQAAGRLIAPRGDNALETYRELLSQNAQHTAALEGVQTVERALAQDIKTSIQNADFMSATSALASARESFPQSKLLLALSVELDQEISAVAPRVTQLSVTSAEVGELVSQESAIAADRVIYIGFEYRNFKSETAVIQAILYDGSRSHQIVQVPVVISGAEGVQFFRMEQPVTGFSEGGYNIDLLFENDLLITSRFSVKKNN